MLAPASFFAKLAAFGCCAMLAGCEAASDRPTVDTSACTLDGSPAPGSGSFTWYYFGQGTPQTNGVYQTACGYQGTESGQTDTVTNIAFPAYFAAIPGKNGFDTVGHCGECVRITNGMKSLTATVIDECPTDNGQNPACASAGHLDLSWQAWNDLGYTVGNPSGTTWQFVPCPVPGNVMVRIKPNNNNQEIYIENVVLPVASVSISGTQLTRTSYGTWQFNRSISGNAVLVMTDVAGRSISPPLGSTQVDVNLDLGMQFPSCP
jgi:hypothetical protein